MSPLDCNVSKCNLIPLPAFSTPLRYSVHFTVHRTANYRQQLTKNYWVQELHIIRSEIELKFIMGQMPDARCQLPINYELILFSLSTRFLFPILLRSLNNDYQTYPAVYLFSGYFLKKNSKKSKYCLWPQRSVPQLVLDAVQCTGGGGDPKIFLSHISRLVY